MKLRKVAPQSIRWPAVRVTNYMDPEKQALFEASLKAQGQVAPILCVETSDGLVGFDGKNRWEQAVRDRVPLVEIAVVPGTARDVYLKNVAAGFLHGKPRPTELVRVVSELTAAHQMDSEEIAKQTGMTRAYVERLWSIGAAHPEILEALDQDLIGISHAWAISTIPDPDSQLRVLELCKLYRWKLRDLEEHVAGVKQLLQARAEAPGPPSDDTAVAPLPPDTRVACAFCGDRQEPARIARPPICPECASALQTALKAEGGA